MNGHLHKAEYRVATASLDTCRRLVTEHHYAHGGSNTATFRHGLFTATEAGACLGVAWWLPPTKTAALATWDGDWRRVLSLSRVVLVPGLPTNAASYLIGRSIRLIRQDGRFRCLVTYADTQQGHTGAIYRATNWEYMGLSTPEPTYVDGEGRMVARKAGPRTRTRTEMVELGCTDIGSHPKHKFRMILPETKRPAPRGQLGLQLMDKEAV